MKKLFYFIFLVLVVLGLFLLGNVLRCVTMRGEACPAWCSVKQVKCLSSECSYNLACRPPNLVTYKELTNQWLKEQQARWEEQRAKLK